MSASDLDTRGVVAGSVLGIAAWVLGYVFTYLIAAPDVRNSAPSQVLELFQGDPATLEIVGWVFYNAHLVETLSSDVLIPGTASLSFIGGDPGFTPWLYVIPVGLLIAAGLAAGRLHAADDVSEGAIAGLTVLPGYLLLAILGTFVFALEIAGGTIAPDLLTAVVLAGLVYPGLCGGVGGALAGLSSA